MSLFDARAGGVYCWDGIKAFRASIEELGALEAPLVSPDALRIQERLAEAGFQKEVREAQISLNQIAETLSARFQQGESERSLTPLYIKELG